MPDRWNQIAAGYLKKAHPLSTQFARRLFQQIPVRNDTLLLDIATGTGAAAIIAARYSPSVAAIDQSDAMLAQLRQHEFDSIAAIRMDGHSLGFPGQCFDVVVSLFGIMLFQDWQQGLREMVRVTKVGGTCGLVVWASEKGAGLNQVIADCCDELGIELPEGPVPAGMKFLADHNRLRQSLRSVGLSDVKVIEAEEVTSFRIDDAFEGNPFVSQLDQRDQQAVLQTLRGKALRAATSSGSSEHRIAVRAVALMGIGTRR
ncbi:MAG: class I SAM-dependent methyltransferase [Planctomycetota bacterium]